jgi:octaprenyl-diphosphate synthase
MNCGNADVDVAAYLKVIRFKTAKLFEASARLGAILGGADQATERALGDYGMHLGTAFQIIDDVLDYSSEEAATGKHLGDDLAEGKPTLPLILAMERGTPEQAALVRHAIENGKRETFGDVLAAITTCGALDAAREAAREEARLAREQITALPASVFSEALLELPAFAVERNY